MGDFHQFGQVTTLHNFGTRKPEDIEKELEEFSLRRPISLVLPSLFSELEGAALKHILEELKRIRYLNKIIIGLDAASKDDFEFAKNYFGKLPQKHSILWHDGPKLTAVDEELRKHGLSPPEPGKGRNVWFCFGYLLATRDTDVVALHDCDILTYKKEMLSRLVYPVANPLFPYVFSKGFYPRIHHSKLGGRVTRLLITPLVSALQKLCGPNDYLSFLESFRYPLAGEFSLRTHLLPDLRIPSDWGLEIGVLSEVRRNHNAHSMAQVEIADVYDHKHQDISLDNQEKGLNRMSMDISKSIFRKLATDGEVFSLEKFRTLKATYFREALDKIDSFYNDAAMNGLKIDRHSEEAAVELFASNIMDAGELFLKNPMETPFLPSWSRVYSAIPDIMEQLVEAVSLDNI